jgi:C4-dicarboxylate-binding protein DctP
MRLRLSLVMAAIVYAVAAGSALAQTPIVIKFSHVVAADTPKGKATEYFKKMVEERSKGRVQVQVYPNSQLYKDQEELEALQLGAVQMLAPSLGKFGPMGFKEFDVFNLPFIFDNAQEVSKVTNGAVGQELLKKLETRGITGLAYWDNGFFVMTANKALRKPDDFKGLKLRVQSSKVSEAEVRALGAIPQVIAFSEVYQALQTGIVDGSDFPTMTNLYTQKIYEVQKFVTLSDHSYLGYAVIVNKKFWDGLPADIRAIISGAMKEATAFNNKIVQQDTEDAIAKVKASGKTQIIVLTPDERKAMRKAMVKVHKEMTERIGKDLLASVYKETGFNPNE